MRIRVAISFLCILTLYLMGLYVKISYDGKKDAILFGLSLLNGLKGSEAEFIYKRVEETKDGAFAFKLKNRLIWVKSPKPHLIKRGDLVSMYGCFGEDNIFYAEGYKLEKLRVIKIVVSAFGGLTAILLYLKAYRFNFKLFLWEPRENA